METRTFYKGGYVQSEMVKKKPKRAVILVLSDSMLKTRYGVNMQQLVNERGKNVLLNAVGGVTAEGAMMQGVESTCGWGNVRSYRFR